MTSEHDVVVVGAGPAGSAAATLLAKAGFSVAIVERERFPRFHIGESLLPSCLPVLAAMGVSLDGPDYLVKLGAEFYDERNGEESYFPFADALPGPPRFAYQVERARFDDDLADAARRAGATMHWGSTVVDLDLQPGGVRLVLATTPEGPGPDEGHVVGMAPRAAADRSATTELRARFLVDASGRRSITGRSGREAVAVPGLGRAAGFVHYDGIADEPWAELASRGNVKVLRTDDGWLWAIPLAGRRLSIGTVVRSSTLGPDTVLEHVAASPLLTRLVAGASVSATRRIADYSYVRPSPAGPRYAAIGDAAGFLDPVFSSGVAIALAGADALVSRLTVALRRGTEDAPDAVGDLVEHMYVAYRTFHAIAHRFYNSRMFDNLFFGDVPDAVMRSGFISLLAGDMWRADNPFQCAVLSAGRKAFAGPPALPWWTDPRMAELQ